MKNNFYFNTLIFLLPFLAYSQKKLNISETGIDSLFIQSDEDNGVFYIYEVKKKQNPSEIGRMFHCNPDDIIKLNKSKNLIAGSHIRIPAKLSLQSRNPENEPWPVVFYKVERSEGLYHIAKRKLNLPLEDLKNLNPLSSYSLKEGQIIQVGWRGLPKLAGNPPLLVENAKSYPVQIPITRDRNLVDSIQKPNPIPETEQFLYDHKGLAYKISGVFTGNRLLALHNFAPLHSTIELINPIVGRKVYAKVVGRIPHVLPKDAILVVSDEVSRELGSFDKRFFIRVRYNK